MQAIDAAVGCGPCGATALTIAAHKCEGDARAHGGNWQPTLRKQTAAVAMPALQAASMSDSVSNTPAGSLESPSSCPIFKRFAAGASDAANNGSLAAPDACLASASKQPPKQPDDVEPGALGGADASAAERSANASHTVPKKPPMKESPAPTSSTNSSGGSLGTGTISASSPAARMKPTLWEPRVAMTQPLAFHCATAVIAHSEIERLSGSVFGSFEAEACAKAPDSRSEAASSSISGWLAKRKSAVRARSWMAGRRQHHSADMASASNGRGPPSSRGCWHHRWMALAPSTSA
mmetsp:Transcript_89465/g.289351  ORF Transcript_89465/g.289351 Transcript_89465/m.289351 type:complete len:293 (+) Transcript_89465:86-964(+)